MTPHAQRNIRSRADAFRVFFDSRVRSLILEFTNLQGFRKYGGDWKEIDQVELLAYIGLLTLAAVYRSSDQYIEELWEEGAGPTIFRATMSLKRFQVIHRTPRFDDREFRNGTDKFDPIREIWDLWTANLKKSYVPSKTVCIDKQLPM